MLGKYYVHYVGKADSQQGGESRSRESIQVTDGVDPGGVDPGGSRGRMRRDPILHIL